MANEMSNGKLTVKGASKERIQLIAAQYLQNIYVTLDAIAESYDVSARLISDILFRGIAEGILSDKEADNVYNKIVNRTHKGTRQRQKRWEIAFDLRAENARIKRLEEEERVKRAAMLEALEYQIASYDDYSVAEEDAPSKEALMAELESLKRGVF